MFARPTTTNSCPGGLPDPNLFNRGFVALLATQFLGAANDNILKTVLSFMVVQGVWAGKLGDGGQGFVSLGLTLPFILFSGYAGQLSDRYSKTRVAFYMKIAEVPIAIIAGLGFMFDNLPLTIIALILLATQSAFFGPAKYGVIPELVAERHLSRANGAINMLTNVAIIGGMILASYISKAYFPTQQSAARLTWLPLVTLLTIAIVGLAVAFLLPRRPAQDPQLRISLNPFATYIHSIREMARTPLLTVALGWAYFYLMGMLALLVLFEYQSLLEINYTKASYLFATLAISIGIGCAVCGYRSGDRIRPELVRYGAFGLTIFFLLLGIITPNMVGGNLDTYYWIVAALLIGLGFAAGFYIVPLQALIQNLAPVEARGQFLGTTNAISFVFTSFAAVILVVLRTLLKMEPNRIFLVCAALAILGVIFTLTKMTAMQNALAEHHAKRNQKS